MIVNQYRKNKNNYKPVSRILSRTIIYLSQQLLAGINLPTLYLERAALKRYYTWHFSLQGLPFRVVTGTERGLLPHIFNLTPSQSDGTVIFCGTFSSRRLEPAGALLSQGALLCAVRTFLPFAKRRSDNPACSAAKLDEKKALILQVRWHSWAKF